MKEHGAVKMKLSGYGEFSSNGALKKIRKVEHSELIGVEDSNYDPEAPAIVDQIAAIFESVSDEEWDRVPADLSARHDHYLYGSEKT